MASTTPRRSSRTPFTHTPKLSERKKGLFQPGNQSEPVRESLTKHRRLPVLDSESDSEDCDLVISIISTLDSSSGEENDQSTPKTPEKAQWHETRSQTRKFLKENQDLKSFIKSPFTLKKYQTRYCPDSRCSLSTPGTPHLQHHPGTPSSTHSCASAHTTSSTSSKARKSLASLIADTESCSSSLKDLTFDTDSGTDSKENTPTKVVRRSSRRQKMTPKFQSFKGILVEQKKNLSPMKTNPMNEGISPMKTAVVCLTKMDMSNFISPTQILKTPQTSEVIDSPPKLGHNRRSVVEIEESPESTCDSEKSHKRLRNESPTEYGPNSKYPRLENTPKARLSLFNSDRLKEILSAKSFYGKSNPELNTSVTTKIANAIEASTAHHRRPFHHSNSNRRKRRPGQINLGVKHRIRKPKHHKNKMMKYNTSKSNLSISLLNNSTLSDTSTLQNTSMMSQNSSQDLTDKADPFDKEKQTIEALLSQWDEEEIPESELSYTKPKELPCFNSTVMEETSEIFQPITAVPVTADIQRDNEAVIVELGSNSVTMTAMRQDMTSDMSSKQSVTSLPNVTASPPNVTTSPHNVTTSSLNVTTSPHNVTTSSLNVTISSLNVTTSPLNKETPNDVVMADPKGHEEQHGVLPKSGQFLPVEGGYIYVEDELQVEEDLPDLDEIERELKMLDEQILKMAESNNMNAKAVLASTETDLPVATLPEKSPLSNEDRSDNEKQSKLFPIFSNPNPGVVTPSSKGVDKPSKKSLIKTGSDQYVIDAGQKKFGATQCKECGTIYQIGDPQDEHDHLIHHNATDVLKYNGLKDEYVVERSQTYRILRSRAGESTWRRVNTLLGRVVHPQLGYEGPVVADEPHSLTAYLYIEKKQIVGCLVAETKRKAYKMIPGDPDCCSVEEYPVRCGISRLWTHINHRKQGIARRLLDCARVSFFYGEALRIEDIAFSAPTAAGKAFATKYCGTENFYVYL